MSKANVQKAASTRRRSKYIPPPHHPFACSVVFPSHFFNASSVIVSLTSLIAQIRKLPSDTKVRSIEYYPIERRLIILFKEEDEQ